MCAFRTIDFRYVYYYNHLYIYSHIEEGHNLGQTYSKLIFTYDNVRIHCGTFIEFLEILVISLVNEGRLFVH